MARIPPPRHPVYRNLRVPDRPTRRDSPLRTAVFVETRKICRSRWLPTPLRLPSEFNGTFPIGSQPYAACWLSQSRKHCNDVPGVLASATHARNQRKRHEIYDTVKLGATVRLLAERAP